MVGGLACGLEAAVLLEGPAVLLGGAAFLLLGGAAFLLLVEAAFLLLRAATFFGGAGGVVVVVLEGLAFSSLLMAFNEIFPSGVVARTLFLTLTAFAVPYSYFLPFWLMAGERRVLFLGVERCQDIYIKVYQDMTCERSSRHDIRRHQDISRHIKTHQDMKCESR